MPPRAILFDFDGVIADTENHHVAAWQRTFGLMGWLVPDEICVKAAEQQDHEFLAALFEGKSIEGGDIDGWVARKQEITLAMLADSPRVYPGISALVSRMKGAVKLAVVTSTWRENVTTVLRASGMESAFDLIVAKEDTPLRKPDPAPYLLALKKLGVAPGEAIAVEDSAGGVASAVGAGVNVLTVGHRHPQGAWTGGSPFVSNFRDIDAVISLLRLTPF